MRRRGSEENRLQLRPAPCRHGPGFDKKPTDWIPQEHGGRWSGRCKGELLMDQESLLLLFDRRHPCWSPDLLPSADESEEDLKTLLRLGLVQEEGPCCFLTESGASLFRERAEAAFLEAEPGWPVVAPRLWLKRNRLERHLDRAFRGKWGEKTFRAGTALPYLPDMKERPLWRIENRRLHWSYRDDEAWLRFNRLCPLWPSEDDEPGAFRRRKTALDRAGITEAFFTVDLLLLHRYDLALYQHLPRPEGDDLELFQTDRFLFRLAPEEGPSLEEVADDMARLHLFLGGQRAFFLPRRFDRDSDGFDDVTWWFWITDREEEASALAERLRPLGSDLAAPALPLELWTLSLEALASVQVADEYHWDLFARTAHSLSREGG